MLCLASHIYFPFFYSLLLHVDSDLNQFILDPFYSLENCGGENINSGATQPKTHVVYERRNDTSVCNTFTQKLDDMLNNGAIITQNICSIRDLVSATCQQTQPIHDLHSSVVTQISRSDEKRPINFSTGRYLTSNNLSLTAVHQ